VQIRGLHRNPNHEFWRAFFRAAEGNVGGRLRQAGAAVDSQRFVKPRDQKQDPDLAGVDDVF
jgi:hypothetical protein